MNMHRLWAKARACAGLTRQEMDALKSIGLGEETAWTKARNLANSA